ncbi:hypothetical protein [uncultured Anaerococcus sp.]|uniref:hypothetical protein n=1 Tax=uncultured Anaerococcus sp. TaxID=293428 RepID=UPI00288A8F53|nr:hypothetical protein [uncultured Anaerococcus sp.]
MAEAKTLQNLKEFKGLVLRADVVSFMEVQDKYYRMKGFTDLPTSKETEEYSRKYVDEKSERTAVTGMTSTTDFTLDRYKDNPVHDRIQEVFDKEQLADDATVNIVVVDFAKPIEGQEGKFYAIKRNHTIVPDSAGDGTDAYQYSGSFKANGPSIEGYAELGDKDSDWLTIKFTEGKPAADKASETTSGKNS